MCGVEGVTIDLEEVFKEICKYDLHLNPEKCTFWVGEGKFLGFMITHRSQPLQMHNHTRDAQPYQCPRSPKVEW